MGTQRGMEARTARAPALGPALRTLRRRKGWTLQEASRQSGVPVSTLSKVENDKLSLKYDKLVQLAERLEVDVALLFGAAGDAATVPAQPFGRRSVQRASDADPLQNGSYGHLFPAADLLNKRLVPVITELHARTLEEFGALLCQSGEEFAFVLEGACEFHTELYAPLRLERGDSVYFDRAMGHAYLAAAPERCLVLSVRSAGT